MKIANIILTSEHGGAEQVFIDYSRALKNLGHEVLAIVKNDAPYAKEALALGIEVKKTGNNFGYHDLLAIKKIRKFLKDFDADAVIAHMGRSVVLARKALKKIKGKKVFLIAVNHSVNVKRSIGADLIFSVNKNIFYKTIDAGQPENCSFVVPNVVDLSDAIEVAPKIDLQKKNKITIGVMGRIEKTKGFFYAIKMLKNLEKLSDKKFILKIAGSGEYEPQLRKLVKELALEDRIEFLGWVKNKKEFFSSIDIFCMSSQQETFGLVLLEAMKYRVPIISTNAEGPKEVLRNEIDALIVELAPLENTETRLADAALRLINEPELTNKIIENSFARLKEKFSHEALEKKLQEVVGKPLS